MTYALDHRGQPRSHGVRPRILSVVSSLALLAACGDSDPVPVQIEVRIAPERIWYHTGQQVTLTGVASDALGAEVPGVAVEWTVEPADFATANAPLENPSMASFTLSRDGRGTFTGCLPRRDEGMTYRVCDSIDVRVDDGAPVLEVREPQAGAELGPDPIVVRGSVTDRTTVRVYVNGTLATVDGNGEFEATLPPLFGVNHLIVSATDGLTDVSRVEMDVLWADGYAPAVGADGRPELALPDGMSLSLGQRFFDDARPLDASVRPIVTRDIADLLELVLTRVSLAGLVPDPVVNQPPAFTLRLIDPRIEEPHAELDLTADGADLFVRIGRLSATTQGALQVDQTTLPLDGTVAASAAAFAHVTIRKESEQAPVEVTLGELSVGLEEVEGTFANEETAAIFRLAEGLLRTTLERALVAAVRGTLEASVPVVLRDALSAIDGALMNRTIPIATEFFPPVTVRLDGRIRRIDTTFRREMLADLRTTIGTESSAVHPESRGAALVAADTVPPAFFRDGSVQLGLRLVLLNALLHALWNSGLLEVDVSPLLPESLRGLVTEARLLGRMPPVLRPPRADETEDLVLTVGQLELELTFGGEPVRFGVSLDAGVTVDVAANRIALGLAEQPEVRVWTLRAPSNPRLLTPETVAGLLRDLWPNLRNAVAGGLGFDLPLPAVGDLGGLAPELAGLTLTLQMTDRIRPREGVLFLDAELLGQLP